MKCCGYFALYFHIHIDGADEEAAFLIERHGAIVFRMDTQQNLPTAEGFGQSSDIDYHCFADSLASDMIVDTDGIQPECFILHNAGATLLYYGKKNIADDALFDLCNIQHPIGDCCKECIFRQWFIRLKV